MYTVNIDTAHMVIFILVCAVIIWIFVKLWIEEDKWDSEQLKEIKKSVKNGDIVFIQQIPYLSRTTQQWSHNAIECNVTLQDIVLETEKFRTVPSNIQKDLHGCFKKMGLHVGMTKQELYKWACS